MTFFNWDNKLDLGVNEMNHEHIKLIEIMNKLHARSEAGAQKTELITIVDELANYTVKHFSAEEKYMETIEFPDLAIHKLIHLDLLKKFAVHQSAIKNGDGQIPAAFFDFLKLWLSAHIQGIDMKYGKFSKEKKLVA